LRRRYWSSYAAQPVPDPREAGGQLTVTQPKIAISNIHVWTSAFMIFMGVMLEKWPNKGQEYLKYMFNVRLAASRRGFKVGR
jgi:hypothetical protein